MAVMDPSAGALPAAVFQDPVLPGFRGDIRHSEQKGFRFPGILLPGVFHTVCFPQDGIDADGPFQQFTEAVHQETAGPGGQAAQDQDGQAVQESVLEPVALSPYPDRGDSGSGDSQPADHLGQDFDLFSDVVKHIPFPFSCPFILPR